MVGYRAVQRVMLVGLVLVGLLVAAPAGAQGDPVTVPDVTGLSAPAAAARLNESGLALGSQSGEAWAEASGVPANTISAQLPAAGASVERGTSVDVTVLRSPNALLLYDAESVTLINQGSAPLNLNGLVFNALDGFVPASFQATNWLGVLDANGHCAQLWSVQRGSADRPAECVEGVQRWLSTVNTSVHFWTGANGVTQFSVVYNGVERAVCEAAAPGEPRKQCAFYLPGAVGGEDATPYVYLAYTTDSLAVINESSDQWMPLAETAIVNANPNVAVAGGVTFAAGDPQLFGNPPTVADVTRLAPGQCLLYTNSSPTVAAPPEDCTVIARLDVEPSLIFWGADFEIISATDGQRYTCPAAVADLLTICVVPR